MRGWQGLFATHRLVHNKREIRKIVLTDEADGGFAVVDIDTLWRNGEGRDSHWCGRMAGGEWKLIMHTGLLVH